MADDTTRHGDTSTRVHETRNTVVVISLTTALVAGTSVRTDVNTGQNRIVRACVRPSQKTQTGTLAITITHYKSL